MGDLSELDQVNEMNVANQVNYVRKKIKLNDYSVHTICFNFMMTILIILSLSVLLDK